MNRENKRKQYEKGYYKTHGCSDSFTCKVCGRLVVPTGAGSDHRNHCPNCLSSLHLDIEPGDREADCGGIMDPVGVWVRKNGEWAIIHRCRRCGHLSSNRDVDCDETTLPTTVPIGKNRGNDRSHGRRWTVILRIKADTINPNILLDNDFEYGIMGHRRRTYHRRDKAG